MSTKPNRNLETFPNPSPDRPYHVHIEVPEFTCLCPLTGQPDFATLVIDYLPDQKNVELKSLKMYMWSYRNEGAFHEKVTNTILTDIVQAIDPRFVRIHADWFVRGGIRTFVTILTNKGKLKRTKQGREFIYSPLVDQNHCSHAASRSFMDRVFGGKLAPLLATFMERHECSPEDLAELKRLLEDKSNEPH